LPITFIDEGRLISLSPQSSKALFPISSTPSEITRVSRLHPAKQLLPIIFTLDGIVMEVNPSQLKNMLDGRELRFSEISTDVILSQPSKIPLPR